MYQFKVVTLRNDVMIGIGFFYADSEEGAIAKAARGNDPHLTYIAVRVA